MWCDFPTMHTHCCFVDMYSLRSLVFVFLFVALLTGRAQRLDEEVYKAAKAVATASAAAKSPQPKPQSGEQKTNSPHSEHKEQKEASPSEKKEKEKAGKSGKLSSRSRSKSVGGVAEAKTAVDSTEKKEKKEKEKEKPIRKESNVKVEDLLRFDVSLEPGSDTSDFPDSDSEAAHHAGLCQIDLLLHCVLFPLIVLTRSHTHLLLLSVSSLHHSHIRFFLLSVSLLQP